MKQAREDYLELPVKVELTSVTLKASINWQSISSLSGKQNQLLTKCRLSERNLAVETGRHRKACLPKEDGACDHSKTGKVQTDEHFLTHSERHNKISTFKTNDPKFDPPDKK